MDKSWPLLRVFVKKSNGQKTLLSPLSSQLSQGFTLLELLVVVAIIGMMTAVLAINANAARSQSRDAKRKTDLAAVAGSIQIYFSEKRLYPGAPTLSSGTANPNAITTTAGSWDRLKAELYPVYLSPWPTDPTNTDGTLIGTPGQGFVYQTNGAAVTDATTGQTLPAGSLFVADVALEATKDTATNTAISCNDPTTASFYQSGIFLCSSDSKYHDRISSR